MASETESFEHRGISGSTENSETKNVFLGWWLSMENMGHTSNSLEDKYEGERVAWTRVGRTQTIQRQNRPTCGIYNQCAEFSCFYHNFFFF
jgi:hypothetical protein